MTSKNPLNINVPRNHELLYGTHTCVAALTHRHQAPQQVYATTKAYEALKHILAQKNIRPLLTTHEALTEETQSSAHQGIALVCLAKPFPALQETLAKLPERATILAIDSIEDTQNFGSICRSAAAFGVNALLLTKTSLPGGSHWKKVASGSLEHISLCLVTNMAQTLAEIQKHYFWCVGLAEQGESAQHPLTDSRVAFVVGGEHKGIRPLVQKKCDFLMRIPTNPRFSTLNMAHACSVVLSQRFNSLTTNSS
ncbi:MAG: RNA methyltransferase [Alphaproteobacteria bacterium]|nr:RNA methyltransferase [Alphaproteobacteria bacterium]